MIFYPHQDELESSSLEQRLEILMEAAERYKAVILDLTKTPQMIPTTIDEKKLLTPRDIPHAFNWEEIAKVLRQIRDLPENSPATKVTKTDRLKKLAAIYEVLRGAKMSKLEAVRLALINEASHLGS